MKARPVSMKPATLGILILILSSIATKLHNNKSHKF